MAQNIDDIIKELDAGYNPQRQSINNRLAQLPGQAEAEIGGLRAQQETSFNEITDGARSRGIGFSGIPISEQAKYTANSFLPAVARVRQSQNEVTSSLTEALNGINTDQRNKAFGIRESQLGREQEESQFQRNLAAQQAQAAASRAAAGDGGAGALASLFGGGDAGPAPAGKKSAQLQRRQDGGYNFQDANGRGISAAAYAKSKNIPFRALLKQMADAGDVGAKVALPYIGNDYGVNKSKFNVARNTPIKGQTLQSIVNSLLGGVNKV